MLAAPLRAVARAPVALSRRRWSVFETVTTATVAMTGAAAVHVGRRGISSRAAACSEPTDATSAASAATAQPVWPSTPHQPTHPLVEMDGDEMSHVVWTAVKDRLIFPYLDLQVQYFNLSLENREATEDAVITDAAMEAIRCKVAVKCPTIAPSEEARRVHGVSKVRRHPLQALCNSLSGTVFSEPIVHDTLPSTIRSWTEPIVVARPAMGEAARPLGVDIARPGALSLYFSSTNPRVPRGDATAWHVHDFMPPAASGVAMATYQTDDTLLAFARDCFEAALARGLSLALAADPVSVPVLGARYCDVFNYVYDTCGYRARMREAGLWYHVTTPSSLVAKAVNGRAWRRRREQATPRSVRPWVPGEDGVDVPPPALPPANRDVIDFSRGGFLWACPNDGTVGSDVVSSIVASGFASATMAVTSLAFAAGNGLVVEPAHGTVSAHYWDLHVRGAPTSTNPIPIVVTWARALEFMGRLHRDPLLGHFARSLEGACHAALANDHVTYDLAVCARGSPELVLPGHFLSTEEMLDAIKYYLDEALFGPAGEAGGKADGEQTAAGAAATNSTCGTGTGSTGSSESGGTVNGE